MNEAPGGGAPGGGAPGGGTPGGGTPGGGASCCEALLICRLFALAPSGMVLHLRSPAGPARDDVVALLRSAVPLRRCPLGIGDDRLLGGLDLAATLAAGRRVAQRGLLAEADGGALILPMAERLTREAAARLCPVLDCGEVLAERDGVALRAPARLGVVLLDEGVEDETPPASLLERAAFRLALSGGRGILGAIGDLEAARALLPQVRCGLPIIQALCQASQSLAIASLRAPMLAMRVARASAALAGRDHVSEDDATLAARLVLAWRATTLPRGAPENAPQQQEQAPEQTREQASGPPPSAASEADGGAAQDGMTERVVEAAAASLPSDLLDRLRGQAPLGPAASGGRRSGAAVRPAQHGRPMFARAGRPAACARLAVVETLRAAAPWQRLRRAAREDRGLTLGRIEVRAGDFRITPRAQSPRSVAIFVVDASGSSAIGRLAEAKGAIERLLADCYVRRDRVALIAFRGAAAELLLPPTSALTRARRSLAGVAGGGGTPLATALAAAATLALDLRKRGETPLLVLLTDGRANVTRAGAADRRQAAEEAASFASKLRAAGIASLLVDISPRPEARAEALAGRMGALYLKLQGAEALSQAVREAAAA